MKNEDKRLAAEFGLLALILAMGVASMISANNIRMHLDIFEWSNNMTTLDPEIIEQFQKKENTIRDELIFGVAFIGGGFLLLVRMLWKYRKKSDDTERS